MTSPHFLSLLRSTVLWLGVLLAVAALRADDVSGTYEAVGADVPVEDGATRTPVSLAALLSLQLDHGAGLKQQADVTTVQLQQGKVSFSLRCLDARNETRWAARWEKGGGFALTPEGVAKVVFRAPHLSEDLYAFTFKLEANGAMLLVELEQVTVSRFGPPPKRLGTFLFARTDPR